MPLEVGAPISYIPKNPTNKQVLLYYKFLKTNPKCCITVCSKRKPKDIALYSVVHRLIKNTKEKKILHKIYRKLLTGKLILIKVKRYLKIQFSIFF